MESPVPSNIQFVCAIEQAPPNAVRESVRTKRTAQEVSAAHNIGIPFVISRNGSAMCRSGIFCSGAEDNSEIRMEKSMISFCGLIYLQSL